MSVVHRWRAARRRLIRSTSLEDKTAAAKQLTKVQGQMSEKQLAQVREEYPELVD